MPVNEYIHRYGFRRWYERQLMESFGYMALGFVALFLLLAGVETMGQMSSALDYVLVLLTAAGGGVLLLVTWRRFGIILKRAEYFAEAATCPGCKVWGKFEVLRQEAEGTDDPPEAGRPHWLKVRCTGCSQEWILK